MHAFFFLLLAIAASLVTWGRDSSTLIVGDGEILITRNLLGVIPLPTRHIRTCLIEEMRPLDFWRDMARPVSQVWGSVLHQQGISIKLRKGFPKRVIIFHENPAHLMAAI